jgi:hypothetical protein
LTKPVTLKEADKSPEREQREPVLPTRKCQPVKCLIEAMMAEVKTLTAKGIEGKIFCLEAMFPVQMTDENPLTVYEATSEPDTMYLHQAMREHDRKQIVTAMLKEVQNQ